MKIINKIGLMLLGLGLFMSSCSKDWLDTDPTDKVGSEDVFSSVEGAQAVLNGAYRFMYDYYSSHDDFGYKAYDLAADMMGEDIVMSGSNWFVWDYLLDNNMPQYRRPNSGWKINYRIIYLANTVIEKSANLPASAELDNVLAQAYAIRGNAYFRLITQYAKTYIGHESEQGIPMPLSPSTDALAPSTIGDVYTQIEKDLKESVTLFASSGVARKHISHVDISVANGFLARVELVMNKWSDAEKAAADARSMYSLNSAAQFQAGFDNAAQQNWIWGFEVNQEQSTIWASFFSHMDPTQQGYYAMTPKFVAGALYNQMNNNDVRKSLIVDEKDIWYDPTFPAGYALVNYKFQSATDKQLTADYVMMRPEEMLLIQAEAQARLGNDGVAQQLLLDLQNERITGATASANTGQALVDEILLERRIELWGEGFSLLDIKRLKKGIDRTNSTHAFLSGAALVIPAEDDRFDRVVPQGETDVNEAYK